MSRAFTKEIDDAPEPPLPDRPVSSAPNRVTPRGAGLIRDRLIEIDDALHADPGNEDLQRERRYWGARQASMQIVRPTTDPTAIAFGTTAKILRRGKQSTVTIVGEDEADPPNGLIAWTSPLARALDGAEIGETVALKQDDEIEVLEIAPAADGQTT